MAKSGLYLPPDMVTDSDTYLHSSQANFNQTIIKHSLIKELKQNSNNAKMHAIKKIDSMIETFEKVEERFYTEMFDAGVASTKSSDPRESVRLKFQEALDGKGFEGDFLRTTHKIKQSYLLGSKNETQKQKYYEDVKSDIKSMLDLIVDIENQYTEVMSNIEGAGYKSSIQRLRDFQKRLTSEYNAKVYNQQNQLTAPLGQLIEPMISALVEREADIVAQNIGSKRSPKTTADLEVIIEGSRKKYGIDIKSSDLRYHNSRVYDLKNILSRRNKEIDVGLLQYISFNFLNMFGVMKDLGDYQRILTEMRRFYFFSTFYRNLVGSNWLHKTAEEVLIMTPKRAIYFTDFLRSIVKDLEKGDAFSGLGTTNFEGLRHNTAKSKAELRKDHSSNRGKQYRAKIKVLKTKRSGGQQGDYRAIHSDTDVRTHTEELIKQIRTASKVITKLSISTANIK